MTAAAFLAIFFGIIAAVVAFRIYQNHQKRQIQTASTCGDVAHPGGTLDPTAWFIGPDLSHIGPPPDWGNKSPGCPPHPRALASGPGFEFDVPVGVDLPLGTGDKLDSMAFNHGPLTGKTHIVFTYEVVPSAPDAQLLAVPEVEATNRFPARITVDFQRRGDDWSTAGPYEAYRWYWDQDVYLAPGVNTLTIPLDGPLWGGTQTSTIINNPGGFKAAIDDCLAIGFGFGGNENGRIHGMRATKPVTIRVSRFEVLP